jgi:hypothetical protein
MKSVDLYSLISDCSSSSKRNFLHMHGIQVSSHSVSPIHFTSSVPRRLSKTSAMNGSSRLHHRFSLLDFKHSYSLNESMLPFPFRYTHRTPPTSQISPLVRRPQTLSLSAGSRAIAPSTTMRGSITTYHSQLAGEVNEATADEVLMPTTLVRRACPRRRLRGSGDGTPALALTPLSQTRYGYPTNYPSAKNPLRIGSSRCFYCVSSM